MKKVIYSLLAGAFGLLLALHLGESFLMAVGNGLLHTTVIGALFFITGELYIAPEEEGREP